MKRLLFLLVLLPFFSFGQIISQYIETATGSQPKLIEIYNKKISNQNDVYDFYFIFKQFCNLILNNINQSDFERNIPKYLFREKGFLLNIFQKYDDRKKVALLKLLLKTEKSFRKDSSLTNMIGLRFLLNFRKLTIS